MGNFYVVDTKGAVIGEFECDSINEAYRIFVDGNKVVRVELASESDMEIDDGLPKHRTVNLFYNGAFRLNRSEFCRRFYGDADMALRFLQVLPYYDTNAEYVMASDYSPITSGGFSGVFSLSQSRAGRKLKCLLDYGALKKVKENGRWLYRIPKEMYDKSISKVDVSNLSTTPQFASSLYSTTWRQNRIDPNYIMINVEWLKSILPLLSNVEVGVLMNPALAVRGWTNKLYPVNCRDASLDFVVDRVQKRSDMSKEVVYKAVDTMIDKDILRSNESCVDGNSVVELFVNPLLMSMTSRIDADTAILFSSTLLQEMAQI